MYNYISIYFSLIVKPASLLM